MKRFMDKDFMLSNKTAKVLYHKYAKVMPVIDYHCHLDPREIAEDVQFENMTKLWLGGDHYKWRLMRSNGIDERLITGDAPDYDKFMAFASVLPRAIGNPMYHWCHLELQRYFGYHGVLNEQTADEVWTLCNEKLNKGTMSAKNLIRMSGVDTVCTTDDPIDDLHWHEAIAKDKSFNVKVYPAWRPDLAMSPEKEGFTDYIGTLAKVSEMEIHTFADLCKALTIRLDYFCNHKCVVTDHGLDYAEFEPVSEEEMENIFTRAMNKELMTDHDKKAFRTMTMIYLGKEYNKRHLVMQLHYGAKRENNEKIFAMAGANAGIDCINPKGFVAEVADFLNELAKTDELPKTIIYSLNPNDNALIGTMIGAFQGVETRGKIQQGAAWWFNDHRTGMIDQMTSLASLGLLGNFVGMLTDSRSFISYPRHEYFRRILCNLIGTWVENGEYPNDIEQLGQLVQDISYNNCANYFNFK